MIELIWSPRAIADLEEIRAYHCGRLARMGGPYLVAITEAFNRRDAKAWTHLATSDAQLVTVRGESLNGLAEIEKGLTALFQGRNRNANLKILDVRVRFIRPDVAIAHVTNKLSGVVNAEGQTLPAQWELSLRVFVKNQGVWRITAFHNTTLQP